MSSLSVHELLYIINNKIETKSIGLFISACNYYSIFPSNFSYLVQHSNNTYKINNQKAIYKYLYANNLTLHMTIDDNSLFYTYTPIHQQYLINYNTEKYLYSDMEIYSKIIINSSGYTLLSDSFTSIDLDSYHLILSYYLKPLLLDDKNEVEQYYTSLNVNIKLYNKPKYQIYKNINNFTPIINLHFLNNINTNELNNYCDILYYILGYSYTHNLNITYNNCILLLTNGIANSKYIIYKHCNPQLYLDLIIQFPSNTDIYNIFYLLTSIYQETLTFDKFITIYDTLSPENKHYFYICILANNEIIKIINSLHIEIIKYSYSKLIKHKLCKQHIPIYLYDIYNYSKLADEKNEDLNHFLYYIYGNQKYNDVFNYLQI